MTSNVERNRKRYERIQSALFFMIDETTDALIHGDHCRMLFLWLTYQDNMCYVRHYIQQTDITFS